MARVKRAVHARKKHKAILEKAKGYYGDRSRTFRSANEQVLTPVSMRFVTVVQRRVSSAVCGSPASMLAVAKTTSHTAV